MLAPKTPMRLLTVVTAILGFLLCYAPSSLGLPENEKVSPLQHDWTIEEIEPTDRDGLSAWARDICTGLDIEVAAKAINVAPTADAVVAALTGELPEDIREDIAEICFESLPKSVG